MTDIAHRSACALLESMGREEISSRQLLDLYLDRVARLDPAINAVVTLDASRARERADAADAARRRGESWGPLHGLPMTVKDCFETSGLRTTAGAPAHADHVPSRDADAVERLLAAGAVIFGKTNTPTYATDWQTDNPLFGRTNNPWDLDRSPGGSSGGSAAAIAAGLSGLELGSDIGGSIRIPAHCCGVFGHKPTWGIVPQRGHIPGLPGSRIDTDINVVGPLARGVDDLELALDVLAGPTSERNGAWQLHLPPPRRRALGDFRVAAWFDEPGFEVDPAVRERLEHTADALRKAGAGIDDGARPEDGLREMLDVYWRLLAPTMTLIMNDPAFADFAEAAQATGAPGDGPYGEFLSHAAESHRDWLLAHERREGMRARFAAFFEDYDVLLCPVSPLPAIRHDLATQIPLRTLTVGGQERSYADHVTWMGPFGALKLPATVAPAGRTRDGLPVGIQIVGPHLEDRTPIAFARTLAAECGGFEPPPDSGAPQSASVTEPG